MYKRQEENGTAVLTLNRPKANALSTEMLGEIKTVLEEIAKDDSVKGVIVTAPGEKFFVDVYKRQLWK